MRQSVFFLIACVGFVSACSQTGGKQAVEGAGDSVVWAVVSAEPVLKLGSDVADAEQQFHRVAGVVRLSDGRIVVADQSRQVRFFNPEGELLGISGGRGLGPGEFEWVGWLKPYRGDSLLVWDPTQARATVLDAQGAFGRTARIGTDQRFPPLVLLDDRFTNGSLLAIAGPPREEQLESGSWAMLPILLLSADGVIEDAIGTFPLHMCGAGEANCAADYKEHRAVWAAGGDRLYYARPDQWEIVIIDMFGRELGRLDGPPVGVRLSRDISRTSSVSAYAEFIVASEGPLWARSGGRGSAWYVFDISGRYAGHVDLPEDLEVHQIGRDFVLGVEKDEWGVEHVMLYELRRMEQSE